VAFVALSVILWALGTRLGSDFLIPAIEKNDDAPQRQGAPGKSKV
jgi:hypothetical protein